MLPESLHERKKFKNMTMRVLIVDDHEVVRRGVRSLLLTQPEYEVCGEAVDGREAVEKAALLKPDLIVMDVSMPNLNGLDATSRIRSLLPDSKVLILSQHESAEMVRQAFRVGARGYVIKSSISSNLLVALAGVTEHRAFIDPAISDIDRSEYEQCNPFDTTEILQRSAALEQALRESEELYRSTFELAELGVAHQSPDGRWLQVNDKLCEITGYSRHELLSMKFQDITHPDDLGADLDQMAKMKEGMADTYASKKRYLRKDGSPVWVNLKVSTLRDQDQRIKRFVVMIEDITERREAEQAQFRLAAIVESSDDAIVSKDLNGIITSWNAAAERVFGFTPQEAIGRPITMIIPPDLQDEEKQILRRLRRGERIEHYETVRMNKSGERLNISLTISPVKDSTGAIVGASKIARDVTERKRIETALRENETRLRAAFTQSYSFLVLLTPDGTILEVNASALAAAGRTREQAVGRKFWEPWWSPLPEETAILKKSIARAAAGERIAEECYFCLADGSRRFAHRTLNPIPGDDGKVAMIVATGLDMTEQKELRDQLELRVKQRTQELEEKNKDLLAQSEIVRELSGKLLSTQDEERRRIARELHDSAGQILAALQMNLTALESEANKHDLQFAANIRQNVDLVDQLSREVRTLSHLLHPPLLDEAGLSSAIRWYVEGFAERSKIDLQLELSPYLGRLQRDQETAMFRIVQECLTNIHRHSGSKRASVRLQRSKQEIRLEVEDYGKGMPFSTNHGSSRKPVRAGVGIQGMRERVTRLGGRFDIHSNGSGTLVTACLPLDNSSTAAFTKP
jgi:PAS domain S-box-containing protein